MLTVSHFRLITDRLSITTDSLYAVRHGRRHIVVFKITVHQSADKTGGLVGQHETAPAPDKRVLLLADLSAVQLPDGRRQKDGSAKRKPRTALMAQGFHLTTGYNFNRN